MQAENKKNNIETFSFGCRLNALEVEKIRKMLMGHIPQAIVVNTCAVTGEAERQSGQAVRKIARSNPNVPIFVTGCAATRNPELFKNIDNTTVIDNKQKMQFEAYLGYPTPMTNANNCVDDHDCCRMSKQFIQIQNGCNHACTYCITRQLRGPSVSFKYSDILNDVKIAVKNGFYEIVLTGVDIASYINMENGMPVLISDLCKRLLNDVPEIQRLRLSSVDPAVPDIDNVIDLILSDSRMMPHLHFSMQSGSDTILRAMGRRHNAERIKSLVKRGMGKITFSWDIICGFPGETEQLFQETLDLIQETKPIKIHAFPFSPRPGTPAADMDNQVNRSVSKKRVKIITELADQCRIDFMRSQIGKTVQVLVENNNMGRCIHDIAVKIYGKQIDARSICDVTLVGVSEGCFSAQIKK